MTECSDCVIYREERNQAEEQERELAADVRRLTFERSDLLAAVRALLALMPHWELGETMQNNAHAIVRHARAAYIKAGGSQ